MTTIKSYMIEIYVKMISKGIRTIDTIPELYRTVVAEKLMKIEEEELND